MWSFNKKKIIRDNVATICLTNFMESSQHLLHLRNTMKRICLHDPYHRDPKESRCICSPPIWNSLNRTSEALLRSGPQLWCLQWQVLCRMTLTPVICPDRRVLRQPRGPCNRKIQFRVLQNRLQSIPATILSNVNLLKSQEDSRTFALFATQVGDRRWIA